MSTAVNPSFAVFVETMALLSVCNSVGAIEFFLMELITSLRLLVVCTHLFFEMCCASQILVYINAAV